MYGAKDCLIYVKRFNLINVNEKDECGNIPLYYLIKNHFEDNHKNKEMFMWLCKGVDVENTCEEGKRIVEIMNHWQNELYQKYGRASLIDRVKNPCTPNIV